MKVSGATSICVESKLYIQFGLPLPYPSPPNLWRYFVYNIVDQSRVVESQLSYNAQNSYPAASTWYIWIDTTHKVHSVRIQEKARSGPYDALEIGLERAFCGFVHGKLSMLHTLYHLSCPFLSIIYVVDCMYLHSDKLPCTTQVMYSPLWVIIRIHRVR